jgi:hypothetical protein
LLAQIYSLFAPQQQQQPTQPLLQQLMQPQMQQLYQQQQQGQAADPQVSLQNILQQALAGGGQSLQQRQSMLGLPGFGGGNNNISVMLGQGVGANGNNSGQLQLYLQLPGSMHGSPVVVPLMLAAPSPSWPTAAAPDPAGGYVSNSASGNNGYGANANP